MVVVMIIHGNVKNLMENSMLQKWVALRERNNQTGDLEDQIERQKHKLEAWNNE